MMAIVSLYKIDWRSRQLAHAAIWLAGVAGFIGPLLMARTSPHADLLRAVAMTWFIVFGVLNAVFVVLAFPRRQRGRSRQTPL